MDRRAEITAGDLERVSTEPWALDRLKSRSGSLAHALYLDGLGALCRLPARRLAPWRLRPCPRRCQEQQHRGRVEQQCHDEDEPPQHVLIAGTEQCGEIADRA